MRWGQEMSFKHFNSDVSDSTGPEWHLSERVLSQGIASSIQKSPTHSSSTLSVMLPTY